MVLLLCLTKRSRSSALTQLAQSLWAQFQKVLCASGGGDLDGVVRRAWHFDVICQVVDRDLPDTLLPSEMWNLGVYRKIYSRANSSEQHDRDSLAPLSTVQRFRFAVIVNEFRQNPAAPAWLWQHQISWQGNSHSPEDFDWLVDYLSDVCSNDHATASDILLLLSSMRVSCSPAKQHLYIEKLTACMGSSMPPRLRHAALRAAHNSWEALASIDVVDDADMILTNLSPAMLTAVCPQPGTTPTEDGPDCFFHGDRDLCYLELIFALAKNSVWHPHLFGDGHIDRCCSIIAKSCDIFMYSYVSKSIDDDLQPHAFYLAGIFLRTTSTEVSSSLDSITVQQWWDLMRKAWYSAFFTIDNTHCVEFLPILVEGIKKYIYIASESELDRLIRDVDDLIERLEGRGLLEQREGVTVAVKELRGIANDMLV
ncbi:hypothetical protein CY34DRAFT_619239 [Suillus luteus UH-Slu-Lm8-n1]|uniref:Uncharacterized protein n=1 Tax=Suillus luteus UH-Slu-Lm8-n1 TaxID=930992 RepID=A0A0D0BMS5_9AGAM|nr:hypothetical protein CY34DRAFT_619239 [Suillus luteus UH-Slu-Lm8-n1]